MPDEGMTGGVGGLAYPVGMSDVPPRYVVYRIYRRTDGVLMYVGSTGRWGLRMSQHEREQWWWSQVGDIKLEECTSRQQAYVIEDIAIEREGPLYNKRRNFAQKVAADELDEEQYRAGGATLAFAIPLLYLLAKWAARQVAWQVSARRSLLNGTEFPEAVVNPFLEDGPAIRIMMAALATVPPAAAAASTDTN